VLAMTWFNGQTGRIVVSGIPVIVILLVVGWLFGAKKKVEQLRRRGVGHRHAAGNEGVAS
jgi:L-asparagine permease